MRKSKFLLLVAVATILAAQDRRSVEGIVSDSRGNPLEGAVVQIQDSKTLQIRSFVAQHGGEYRFNDLKPDVDYSLVARYHRKWGKAKTLSQFNSHKQAEINLTVPVE
jgi:hypothetical protein